METTTLEISKEQVTALANLIQVELSELYDKLEYSHQRIPSVPISFEERYQMRQKMILLHNILEKCGVEII